MIECSICFNALTNPCAAACGHIFCTACIEKWLCCNSPGQLHPVCHTCPSCNSPVFKSGLRRVYVSQSEALVEELSVLRVRVKDLGACNAALKAEVEGLREGFGTRKLLVDVHARDKVARAIQSVFVWDIHLLGKVSASYEAATTIGSALLLQTVLLALDLAWHLVTRPDECLRQAALYVWIYTDFVVSVMILSVVLLGVLCGERECMVIWRSVEYPKLRESVEVVRSITCLVRRGDGVE